MNNKPTCHPEKPESGQQLLSIEEKRAWLAHIFRDTSGKYTDADKLKALEADNRLVALQNPTVKENLTLQFISKNHEIKARKRNKKYRNDR